MIIEIDAEISADLNKVDVFVDDRGSFAIAEWIAESVGAKYGTKTGASKGRRRRPCCTVFFTAVY